MATPQPSIMRNTGVDVVGDIPSGTHFCLFYDTKADLPETLVPYCGAGLQSHEFCLWVVAPAVTQEHAPGDTAWLERKHWKDLCEYEDSLNECIANQRLAVLCTYPLAACGAGEILDVVRTHQFAVTKRRKRGMMP
jgi:hypothetical protein